MENQRREEASVYDFLLDEEEDGKRREVEVELEGLGYNSIHRREHH